MDGVWRTIGGRRVFIQKGQSLTDAMKSSGKFKTDKKDIKGKLKEQFENKSRIELNKKIKDIEEKRKNLNYEEGTILDKNGNIISEFKGEEHQVNVSDTSQLKNSIFTHNHPTGGTFSKNDLKSYIEYDLYEMRASTDTEYFSLRKGNDTINTKISEDFSKESYNSYSYASQKMQEKWKNNALEYNPRENSYRYMRDLAKEQAEYYDKWFKENATKYGYIYERGKL